MICSLDKSLIKSVWDISFMMTDKIKTAVVKRTLARLGVDLFTVGRWWWHKYKSTNHSLAPSQLVWMVNLIFCLPVLASNNILFSLHSFKVYIDWNKVMTWYTTGPHSTRPQIQTFLNSIPVGSIQSHIVENHFLKEKHMFEASRLCLLLFLFCLFVCIFETSGVVRLHCKMCFGNFPRDALPPPRILRIILFWPPCRKCILSSRPMCCPALLEFTLEGEENKYGEVQCTPWPPPIELLQLLARVTWMKVFFTSCWWYDQIEFALICNI